MFSEFIQPKVIGHLKIYEENTGKILLDQHNAIHPENMSNALAMALSNNGGFLKEMCFGNGGVKVNASNEYLYTSPQTIGKSASLYSQTYSKVVDQNSSENVDKTRNFMEVSHVVGNVYTDIMIQCALEMGEPTGQNVLNNESNIISEYSFSEIGLKNIHGDLLTHICFYPILKSNNVSIVVNYLIRIMMV